MMDLMPNSSWKGLLEELVQIREVNVRFTFKGRKIDFKDFKDQSFSRIKNPEKVLHYFY